MVSIESRDSVSLKPVELDEFSQLLGSLKHPIADELIDAQIEQFPLVVFSREEEELKGFMFGSLERVGGTPCILWGLGAVSRGKTARAHLEALLQELARRAAISFPDEDVLVAGRIGHPAAYTMLSEYDDIVPRKGYVPTGEERAWGRRLSKRFNCDSHYEEKNFQVKKNGKPAIMLETSAVKLGGAKASEMIGAINPLKGEALISFGWATAESLAAVLEASRIARSA